MPTRKTPRKGTAPPDFAAAEGARQRPVRGTAEQLERNRVRALRESVKRTTSPEFLPLFLEQELGRDNPNYELAYAIVEKLKQLLPEFPRKVTTATSRKASGVLERNAAIACFKVGRVREGKAFLKTALAFISNRASQEKVDDRTTKLFDLEKLFQKHELNLADYL